mgnify:CR=1 FL=1
MAGKVGAKRWAPGISHEYNQKVAWEKVVVTSVILHQIERFISHFAPTIHDDYTNIYAPTVIPVVFNIYGCKDFDREFLDLKEAGPMSGLLLWPCTSSQ